MHVDNSESERRRERKEGRRKEREWRDGNEKAIISRHKSNERSIENKFYNLLSLYATSGERERERERKRAGIEGRDRETC